MHTSTLGMVPRQSIELLEPLWREILAEVDREYTHVYEYSEGTLPPWPDPWSGRPWLAILYAPKGKTWIFVKGIFDGNSAKYEQWSGGVHPQNLWIYMWPADTKRLCIDKLCEGCKNYICICLMDDWEGNPIIMEQDDTNMRYEDLIGDSANGPFDDDDDGDLPELRE